MRMSMAGGRSGDPKKHGSLRKGGSVISLQKVRDKDGREPVAVTSETIVPLFH